MRENLIFKLGEKEIPIPPPRRSDIKRKKVGVSIADAELMPQGALVVIYTLMLDDPFSDKPKNAMKRFCQYIEQQGCGKPAKDIFAELLKSNKKKGVRRLNTLCKKYVSDDDSMIKYIFGGDGVGLW